MPLVIVDADIRSQLDARAYHNAFESLLDRYQHKVFRLAAALLDDPAAAEDAAQDVFVQVWKALPGYRGEASLSTWIYVITRNLCLTRRKQMAARRAISIEEPGIATAMESRHAASPPSASGPNVSALLACLPPQYREIMTLFYLEEKSYEEVAAMLVVPVGTVKTYLHRARKQLARSLERQS